MLAFLAITILLLAVSMAWVLPRLWRGSRRTAMALAVFLPSTVALLYLWTGRPEALTTAGVAVVPTPSATVAPTGASAAGSMSSAIAKLEQRLADSPGDADGWMLLGRSRMVQEQYVLAREAFANAYALLPNDPDVMVDYAEAQMRAYPGEGFPPAAADLLQRALVIAPLHPRGLFIFGVHRSGSGERAEAAAAWEKLLPLLDEAQSARLRLQIAQARGAAVATQPNDTSSLEMPAAEGVVSVVVQVTVAPAMAASIAAGDSLFVIARTADGSGPPAAVKRIAVGAFPMQIILSDNDSMLPTLELSAQKKVRISARLSKSGSAMPAAGDIESAVAIVEIGSNSAVSLVLSKIRR